MIELRRRGGRVLRVGHRGAAALAPENTLRSLQRAIELGVDQIEFDVLDLADGTLVLAHSHDLAELTHGALRGRVGRRGLAELRRLAPELPTLDEALEFLNERAPTLGLHVDVKCHGQERGLVKALRQHGVLDRALVNSFSARTLRAVGRLEPALPLAYGYPSDRFGVARWPQVTPAITAGLAGLRRTIPRRVGRWLRVANASAAMLHFAVLSRPAVERCHALGAAVFAWTVNDRTIADSMIELGVDGVISDDPRIFRG